MWLQTTAGAFSIVLADTESGSGIPDPNTLMIRARTRAHLARLKREQSAIADFEIIESEADKDYRWRMIVPKAVFMQVLAAMVEGIAYRNFKSACAAKPELGAGYNAALHDVWAVLRRMQK